VRLIIAVALFSLFFLLDGNNKYFALLGIVPLVTALLNYCPLYSLLGIKKKK
jgi:hypothetical protein